MKRLGIAAALAVLAFARSASAHPIPFSYLDLRVQPDAIDGTLIAHIFDVAHDLSVDPPERLLDPAFGVRQARALPAPERNRARPKPLLRHLASGPGRPVATPGPVRAQRVLRQPVPVTVSADDAWDAHVAWLRAHGRQTWTA